MRFSSFIITVLAIAIITSVSFYYILGMRDIYEVRELPMNVQVEDFVGFDLNNKSLNFGALPPTARSRKNITITSYFEDDVLVRLKIRGEIKRWVTGYDDLFVLYPNQSKQIMFVLSPPAGTAFGVYNGTALISFHRMR